MRALLAVPILLNAKNENWVVAFWFLILALSTDFLDGLAAKKLNAQTKLGALLDVLSDFCLAAAGVAGLILSGHFPLAVGIVMFLPAVLIAYERWIWKVPSVVHNIRPIFSATYLFAVWMLVTWEFAALAYGWYWWYVPATILVVAGSALKKRHRVRAFYGYLLDKYKPAE